MTCVDKPSLTWLDILKTQLAAWNNKPSLRYVYTEWFKEIAFYLSPGISVEIGCGIGRMKCVIPDLFSIDIVKTPWTDIVGDAHQLAVKSKSISNIILFDVLHHLPYPLKFLSDAFRALRAGGRLIIIDPYISPFSGLMYGCFHPEPFNLKCNPFRESSPLCLIAPLASNQAIGTLLFYRHRKDFQKKFSDFQLINQKRFAFFAYPATGGFGSARLIPDKLISALHKIEPIFKPLAPILAFRLMVVLEKR
jgi:SAM-dependent methyltransferase